MAAKLARAKRSGRKRPIILHTNGLLGTGCLAPLRDLGFPVGRLHPFVAVARATPLLPGESSFGISGDPRAASSARGLVRWMDGRALRISSQDSGAYHAAASLLGGGLVALHELANRVLARSIIGRERRRKALSGLSWSVLLNIDTVGVGRALTGALARGAEDIVRGHVEVLRVEPRALEAYRVLGAVMLELARTRGSIDAATERRMRRLLGWPLRTG